MTEQDDGTYLVDGPIIYLLEILAQRLHFRYELVKPVDGEWGVVRPNGSWSGMMGMVAREEVEFALGPFYVSPEREGVVDFATAVHFDTSSILTKRPSLKNDITGFIKPFTLQVWFLILVSMLAMIAAMVGMVKGEYQLLGRTTPANIFTTASNWVMQTFSQESCEWLPIGNGGRVLVTTWLLASLVFMSSYSGILVAMLTVPRVTIPIDSLADLVAQSDMPWRLEKGALLTTWLAESADEVKQAAVSGMSGTIPDCWGGRDGLVRGEFAALCDETTQKKVMAWDVRTSGQCHLYITRQKIFSSTFAVAFKRGSSYLKGANKIILKLRETGLLRYWLYGEVGNPSQCLKPPTADRGQTVQPLALDSFLGPVLFIVGGWLIAVTVLIMEILVDRFTILANDI